MPKVSIIVPTYNVEKYLRECLDSIVNQTLKDLEIICVNDGSTDSSGSILDEYASRDSRIKVIHKENGGYGKAMNVGMDNAIGEYIGIVEPDDYVDINMFENLYYKAIETNVDFVKSDFYKFSEDLIQYKCKLDYTDKYYNKIINVQNEKSIFYLIMNTWTGIYKSEFLKNNNIRYNETPGARYQDQGFWFQTMAFAKNAYVINKPFYHYRYFSTNSSNNKNGFNWIEKEYDYIYNILKNKNCSSHNIWAMYYKFKFACYLFNYQKLDKETKKEKLYLFRDIILQDIETGKLDKEVFNDYEQKAFDLLINNPNKFYRKMTNSTTLLQKIFSIKNTDDKTHKIITILGIKIKIKRRKKISYNQQ